MKIEIEDRHSVEMNGHDCIICDEFTSSHSEFEDHSGLTKRLIYNVCMCSNCRQTLSKYFYTVYCKQHCNRKHSSNYKFDYICFECILKHKSIITGIQKLKALE